MVDFQFVLVGPPIPDDIGGTDERFAVEQQSRRALKDIEKLESIWDTVIEKLTALATKSRSTVAQSPYELDSIEFNIGIEAGISVGLVTKGEASVSLTFTRRIDKPGVDTGNDG